MNRFARRAWNGLKALGKGLALLVALIVLAAVAFIWRPEWVLKPPLLAKLTQKYGKPHHLKWSSFELAIRSKSFRNKEITLKTDDFCFRESSGAVKGCFNRIDVALTVELGLGAELTEIDHFDVDGRRLFVDSSKPAPPPKNPKKPKASGYHDLAHFLPNSLRELKIREMRVRLPDTKVVMASTTTLEGDLTLTFSTAQSPPLTLDAQLYYDTPLKGENLSVKLAVDSDLFTKGNLTFLRAKGRLSGDVEDSGTFDASVTQKSQSETVLKANARLINGTRNLRAGLNGSETADKLTARLNATLTDSSGTLREVSLRRCTADAPLDKKQNPTALKVDCRVLAQLPAFGKTPNRPEDALEMRVALDAKMKPTPLASDRFQAALTATIAPAKRWYDFHAKAEAQLAGRLHDLPKSLTAKHRIDAGLKVAKFQDLVKFLQGTPYAVPAPLHVLDGPVDVTLNSNGDTTKPDQKFVYKATTNLTSGRQNVVIAVDGTLLAKDLFTPGRRLEDTTEVALQNIALELPYLKLGTVPAVSVDSRIRTGEETEAAAAQRERQSQAAQEGTALVEKSTPTSVVYRAHIATVKPIILYSNLNPHPIPIGVDLVATAAGMAGDITVESFEADLFKRKAMVQKVALHSEPGAKSMDLDGLILFKLPDADVSIKLLGSTEKPQVVFESDPPMNQQDIVALLLFGKSPDDLDPDQTTTASNSQSAMASGAFGLASLYLFASTPIQYVGYDPATQSYAMKFSLPGGASLEVGSNSQQSSHLTLRKRLARHWVIATEVQRNGVNATNPQPQNAVTTFLEWFQRY